MTDQTEIIETQHGRGYRFVVAVMEQTDEPVFQFGEDGRTARPCPTLFFRPKKSEARPVSFPSSFDVDEGQEKSFFSVTGVREQHPSRTAYARAVLVERPPRGGRIADLLGDSCNRAVSFPSPSAPIATFLPRRRGVAASR